MPNDSGKIAPAAPCSARAAIRVAMDIGQGRGHGSEGEDAECHGQQPSFAVGVAQLAERRGRDRRCEQEAGEHPGRPCRGGVQVLLEDRQRGHHQRLLQDVRHAGDRQHGEREAWAAERLGGIG